MKAVRLTDSSKIPTKTHKTDGGYDLYANEDVLVYANNVVKVRTGIALEIPVGYVGLIRDRSSTGSRGLSTVAGVVDSGFAGELLVCVHYINPDNSQAYKISKGDRIAQIVIVPILMEDIESVDSLSITDRGNKGFGSSGV